MRLKRPLLGRSKLIWVALVLAAFPGIAFYLLARTSLLAKLVKLVGTPTLLALAAGLLALMIGTAIFALVYGFDRDEPPRRRRRSRRSARSRSDEPRLEEPSATP